MAVGTTLPSGCYLSVANPPSRDAESGLTHFGWFYVPSFSGFHSTMLLHYATGSTGEGFQFEASSATQAGGFIMCFPGGSGTFTSLGGTYTSGTWYFQAEVYEQVEDSTVRKTYISNTPGATPTLVSTTTWTAPDAAPSRFDIGEAEGYGRSLRGSAQYTGLAPIAMTPAQLAAQSASKTATVSCWVFLPLENGSLVDTSGNNRTVTVTGGTPTASTVGAPLSDNDMAANATIGVSVSASTAAVGSMVASSTIGLALEAQAETNQPIVVIAYGNSVTSGYGVSDPSLHYPEQLALLLGSRVESVVKLGYPGVATASLDSQFATNVGPYIQAGKRTILIWQEVFNSAHSGVDSAAIMVSYWSVCAKARAAGCEVIVQDTSAASLARQSHPEVVAACNAAMASEWGSHADGFIKISTTFYDPTNTTLYQEDRAHFTPTGLHTLAELSYTEVDRLLLGGSFMADMAANASIGVAASTSVAGLASIAAEATVGVALSASTQLVQDMAANATIGIDASPQLSAYGSMGGNISWSVGTGQTDLEYGAGPMVAGADLSIGMSGALAASGDMAANLTIGLSVSSRFSAPYARPFDAYAQVLGDGLVGSTLLLTCTLTDATGAPIDAADAEVHVFSNGVQTSVLRRSSGAISRNAESGEYSATLVPADATLAMFCWHFPALAQRAAPVTRVIRGPALTEQT